MAHLEVEPKPARPWWVWLIIILVVVAILAMLFRQCGSENTTTGNDTNGVDTSEIVAVTTPNWTGVDFNSATMTDADISDPDVTVRGTDEYTIYSLGENILFPVDGATISEGGTAKLQMIADILQKRFAGATIGIYGSTDATGSASENADLGQQRAEAVKSWLTAGGKVDAGNVSVQSLGETVPVATNQTAKGRQQNRNVSIVVFPK